MKLTNFVKNNLIKLYPSIQWNQFDSYDSIITFIEQSSLSKKDKMELKFLVSYGRILKVNKPKRIFYSPKHWEDNELVNCNDQYWMQEIKKRGGKMLIDTKGFPPYRVFKRLHRKGMVSIIRERSYTVNKTFVVLNTDN